MFHKRLFNWSVITKITILVMMLILKECHAVKKYNLALSKRTYLSSLVGDHYGRFAVDGVDTGNYAHADNLKGDPWFVVDLGRPQKIEYIDLHKCDTCDKQKFFVGLLNNFDLKSKTNWRARYTQCYYLRIISGFMHYSCNKLLKYFRYVMVQSININEAVMVSEIKVIGYSYIYRGCFKKIVGAVDTEKQEEDVVSCFKSCYFEQGKQNHYAALKNNRCSCALNMKGLLSLNKCRKQCKNDLDYCGGLNVYSVYEEGDPRSVKLDHHCKNDAPLNDNWICDKELCEDGWIGDSCLRRDCAIHNGACEHHKCNKAMMPLGTTGECICNKGYVKSFWWENCRDVDECIEVNNSCNYEIANCINTPGAYTCACFKDGLTYDYKNHLCPELIREDEHSIASAVTAITVIFILVIVSVVIAISVHKFLPKNRTGALQTSNSTVG